MLSMEPAFSCTILLTAAKENSKYMFIHSFLLFTCLIVTKSLLSPRHQMINIDCDDLASAIIELMI